LKELEVVKLEDKVIKEGDEEIVVLEGDFKEEEDKLENYRHYKMYIVYDEYYHTPRMYFSANHHDGTPVSNDDIRQDIQREYLDKTLTMEKFPFLEGVTMPTVHPCRHAAVLKTMSDSMVESGHKIGSHFALLIFLKFISSVIPYVEFDVTGDLIFN
jgi:ubiquitin-like-conjugating enzyme ATG3